MVWWDAKSPVVFSTLPQVELFLTWVWDVKLEQRFWGAPVIGECKSCNSEPDVELKIVEAELQRTPVTLGRRWRACASWLFAYSGCIPKLKLKVGQQNTKQKTRWIKMQCVKCLHPWSMLQSRLVRKKEHIVKACYLEDRQLHPSTIFFPSTLDTLHQTEPRYQQMWDPLQSYAKVLGSTSCGKCGTGWSCHRWWVNMEAIYLWGGLSGNWWMRFHFFPFSGHWLKQLCRTRVSAVDSGGQSPKTEPLFRLRNTNFDSNSQHLFLVGSIWKLLYIWTTQHSTPQFLNDPHGEEGFRRRIPAVTWWHTGHITSRRLRHPPRCPRRGDRRCLVTVEVSASKDPSKGYCWAAKPWNTCIRFVV